MNANFAEILSMQLDDIKPLKPLPPGSYLAVISNDPPPHTEQRGKNNNHCIVFKIKLMQALDQSPSFQDQLYDALDGKSLSDVPINHTLWLTNDSMYRVKIFFEDHLGIRGMGIGDALANAVGKQLIVVIGHYERDGQIRMEIKSTAKV